MVGSTRLLRGKRSTYLNYVFTWQGIGKSLKETNKQQQQKCTLMVDEFQKKAVLTKSYSTFKGIAR